MNDREISLKIAQSLVRAAESRALDIQLQREVARKNAAKAQLRRRGMVDR